jgi:hypothetical protein
VPRLRQPVSSSAQSGARPMAQNAKPTVAAANTRACGRSIRAWPYRSASRAARGVTTANSTAPAADTAPAMAYRPVTATTSSTWARLSMPIGSLPTMPGSANMRAPGARSASRYRASPVAASGSAGGSISVCIVVMCLTLGGNWSTGKLQFHAG